MTLQYLLGQSPRGREAARTYGGKRERRGVNDSTHLTNDLVSTGMPIASSQCTYIPVVITAHSNIPATSQTDQKLSKNQTSDVVVVRLPTTKRLASNLLQAKASDDKSPTIVTPIITVRPDGALDKAHSTPFDEAALWSPSLAGSYEGIALAKPPLVKEITVRLPKFKSLIHQGALDSTQDNQKAAGQEAASAQAVERGHQVTLTEIPDNEDDTSFIMNKKANLTPPLETAVTSPTVVEPSQVDVMAKEALQLSRTYTSGETYHEWLKLFGAEWTLRSIVQAKTESEVKAILKNWIHKARAEEVVDDMIEGMRKAMRIDALWWLEELRQPRRYISMLSWKGKDLTINVQIETLENQTKVTTTALVDSGCTSSAINQAFVKKHNIPTHATAAPIPVYNADGTRNQGGSITQYAEIRLVVGDHAERIDLAVTELGDKQIFLGHDWLARHNPIINWKSGGLTFARCQCRKSPFVLPDADPDDKWDEELEEGETILAIDFTQAILIHAHHANDLATKASKGKEAKTFEEMVPKWCRDFTDLFEKENFDELPEPKTWDHAIELTPNANANLDCKVYPLNRNEQAELDKFLDENLSSG